MRAREFIQEDASASATTAGSMAAVAQPLGGVITRWGSAEPAKYKNSVGNATKRKNKNARG